MDELGTQFPSLRREGVGCPSLASRSAKVPEIIQAHIDDFYSSPMKRGADGILSLRGGSPRKEECELLANIVLCLRPSLSVDWGLGDGAVAMTIALARRHAGLEGRHIAVDPFQQEVANGVGLVQLERRGLIANVDFLDQRSDEFLIRSRQEGRRFDFAFVDGDHSLGGKVADAHLADQVLHPGGAICFHDSLFKSTATAISYLVNDLSYEIMDVNVEPAWIVGARAMRHAGRLGSWYTRHVVPMLGYSIAVLRKPETGVS